VKRLSGIMYAVEDIESASSRAKRLSTTSISETTAQTEEDIDEGWCKR